MKKRLSYLLLFFLNILIFSIFPLTTAANKTASLDRSDFTRRITRVGVIALQDYAEKDEDGSYNGVNVEYAYKIAQYANLNVEIVLYQTGKQALADLDAGKLDMMCNVVKTPERQAKYLFSNQEVGRLSMCVFVRHKEDRFTFGNARQLATMTFGAERFSTVSELFTEFCSSYGIVPAIQTFADLNQVKAAVDSKLVDAGLYGSPAVAGYHTIQNFSPVPYYFIFRKTDQELRSRVDEAMGNILAEDAGYYNRLVQKYTMPDFTMEMLSREEKAYIVQHPNLLVAILTNDPPYYSLDSNKQPKGIIPDFYAKLAQLTGLHFSYKAYDSDEEAVQAVKSGAADVLGLYGNGQIPAYGFGLRLTRPYDAMDTVLLTKAGTTSDELKKLAIKKRSRKALLYAAKAVKNAEIISYANTQECFAALKKGEVNGVICGMPSATWLVNQHQAAAYKLTTLDAKSVDICGATSYDNPLLCSLLSKAINAASYSFNEIVTDNTLPKGRWETLLAQIPSLWIVTLTTLLLLLVIGLILALITLRRRQKEQEAVNKEKTATELRKIEVAALMKNVEERNAFFSNISHDMRTPLNAILGFTKMARQKGLDPQQQNDYLEKVEVSGQLLLELINDTLTISKANSGKLELHPEPITAAQLFDAIAVPVQHAAEGKKIIFTADRGKALPRTLLVDKLAIEKIFLNLLTNAIKYTPKGGHVWFTVDYEKPLKGKLQTILTVKDDGIGIAPEFLEHLYEPFSQERRAGYATVGTGLGLSIVKRFVDLLGGTIEVTSVLHKGTKFTVRLCLPEAPAGTTAPRQAAACEVSSLQGKQILICEDNKLNQEIACVMLKNKGLKVLCAPDGQAGLDLFASSGAGTIDAILMDIHMPVLDGLAATRRIRALPRPDALQVPIIAMTADAFEEDVEKCKAAGMNGHIAKPISPTLLLQALAQALQPHPAE